ncbi:MAG: TIGR02147 family protein [Fibrobacteria bacterium]
MSEPSIYQYLDYRLFIKDRFRRLQSHDSSFSQRKLARVAGFANPGFFNEVIKGRRKLSSAAIERMGAGLSLDANEIEFLRMLVALTDAKDTEEKRAAMRKLEFRRNRSFFRRLNQSQCKYYLDLNYPLVRAAIGVCDFRGDYQVLGDFLRPPMTAASIKRYVRDLCEWELVAQDSEGRYNVTHSFLEPPEEMKDSLVRLQQAWLTQSAHLLSTVPASERHVSSALLTVSEGTYKAILERVEKMREELLELVRADESSERVVQFNIQVFPRSGGKRIRTHMPALAKGGAT